MLASYSTNVTVVVGVVADGATLRVTLDGEDVGTATVCTTEAGLDWTWSTRSTLALPDRLFVRVEQAVTHFVAARAPRVRP